MDTAEAPRSHQDSTSSVTKNGSLCQKQFQCEARHQEELQLLRKYLLKKPSKETFDSNVVLNRLKNSKLISFELTKLDPELREHQF